MSTQPDKGAGWAIQAGLQIIAIVLCSFILVNMAIEDAQPPRSPVVVTAPCTDFGVPK